jgi:RNA polymerase sigma factor (sigma-70 family)
VIFSGNNLIVFSTANLSAVIFFTAGNRCGLFGILRLKTAEFLDEEALIKGCIRQDAHCQRMLFNQYAGKMMALCLRYTNSQSEAEDVMQEGFIKIFRYIFQFKFEGSFEGWMRRIMVNTALKELKKRKLSLHPYEETSTANHATVDNEVYSNLGQAELLRLINELPEGYRLVFNLNVVEGFSHEEIAEILQIQPATSRSQLVKARRMLQQKIISLQKIAV